MVISKLDDRKAFGYTYIGQLGLNPMGPTEVDGMLQPESLLVQLVWSRMGYGW
jgi:hypothetical protein